MLTELFGYMPRLVLIPNIVLDDNTGPARSVLLTSFLGVQFNDDNVAAAYLHE